MHNTAVYYNKQDYRIFVSFRGQSLQLAGIDGALLIKPLLDGRPFRPSLFQCAFLLLSALRTIKRSLQGVTVIRTLA
jgi:hypothetical protein